ncbi:MAG TPA: ATP-binding protein [Vicinamibacterales bacterium]|nr:ATP-binding protein [Vicinamibacterales bacterium]
MCLLAAAVLVWVAVLQRRVARLASAHRRAEDQVRSAQRVEAIGRLAGGIAHDYNNLLTVVLGYCDVIEGAAGGNRDILAALHEIRGASRRASASTRRLLALGRPEPLQPSVVDLNAVVGDMCRLLEHVVGPNVTVLCPLSSRPLPVLADRTQLDQAILNLVVNARDAMPAGGTLTITATNTDAFGVVSVTDTGMGIPVEAQAHIFDPFFTTKSSADGSGLGLAMVHSFVQQSGGQVTVRSTPGHGATFELALPLASRAGVPA